MNVILLMQNVMTGLFVDNLELRGCGLLIISLFPIKKQWYYLFEMTKINIKQIKFRVRTKLLATTIAIFKHIFTNFRSILLLNFIYFVHNLNNTLITLLFIGRLP